VVELGRPALPRGVFSFETPDCATPELLTLDSSFVVSALLSGEDHHAAARSYLERLADNDTVLVFNHLLELELREVAFRAPLIEAFPKDWRRRRHDGRTLRRARRLIDGTMSAWEELLTAFGHAIVQVDAVYDRVPELMDRYGLQSYDAVHAATAEIYGTGEIVTTDVGFASMPEKRLTLYVNTGRMGRCRTLRARRRSVS
jgi:predicted nucleic acid-binding protein